MIELEVGVSPYETLDKVLTDPVSPLRVDPTLEASEQDDNGTGTSYFDNVASKHVPPIHRRNHPT